MPDLVARGPFHTGRQALDAALLATGGEYGTLACQQLLLDTLNAAGVALGAYDRRIVDWLAGLDTQTCVVIADLITRAALRTETPDAG